MKDWLVIYRPLEMGPLDYEFFACSAEDMDHAEEQCYDAYPSCDILWVDTREKSETIKDTAERMVIAWLNIEG